MVDSPNDGLLLILLHTLSIGANNLRVIRIIAGIKQDSAVQGRSRGHVAPDIIYCSKQRRDMESH